ncbi:MAG: Uma2 family endonuclease [Chloroflexi bacterium]|nr:Uma2 family endonuclease [Chloroflexota bacterium]
MIKEMIPVETTPLVLHFGQTLRLSDDEYFELCQLNKDLRIERTVEGDIIIMPPTGGESGRINFSLAVAFGAWAERDGTGVGFDSSTEFALPNGAKRSPDVAWVKRSRWNALTAEEREKFPPLCPDFVVEIRSRTDSLKTLQAKMEEYIANGAALGWLIDPLEKRVHVYRPHELAQVLENPAAISGESILRGFTLDLQRLWN